MSRSLFLPVFTSLALLCCAGLHAQEREQRIEARPLASRTDKSRARELRDLPYVTNGHERQRLDLFLPPDNGSSRPLVVWVHGGGWEQGSKDRCPAKALVARGYAVASIGYRLSQHAIFPAQIEDCKAAIRWLRAHAQEYGIDPKRVGVWGASAGGHLVALLGPRGISETSMSAITSTRPVASSACSICLVRRTS